MPYKALITVPVADLVGSPIHTLLNAPTLNERYALLPHASAHACRAACPRMHQLLFNEIVEVLETLKDEVKVRISTAFFITPDNRIPQTTYWMRKDAVTPLYKLTPKEQQLLPPPIQYQEPQSVHNPSVATVRYPWYDPITHLTFSAGTRFLIIKQTATTVVVWRFVPHLGTSSPMTLEKKACIIHHPHDTDIDRRALFVTIIRSWAHEHDGIIPYVLGGTSFTQRLPNMPYAPQTLPYNEQLIGYTRAEDSLVPKGGLDCTGLVLRAAQMAGIGYFLKNSTTIGQYLKPLVVGQKIQEGDVILIKGHVLVVVDVQRNTIVEARSYEHGYGKIQELPLHKVFNAIAHCDDLLHAYFEQKPLDRIDSTGVTRDRFPQFSIMRLI